MRQGDRDLFSHLLQHAPMDAPVPGKMIDHAISRVDDIFREEPADPMHIEAMEWRVPEGVARIIGANVFDSGIMLSNINLKVLHYEIYGASFIKKGTAPAAARGGGC